VIHFCTTRFGYELIQSKPSWFRYDLVWNKTNAVGFLGANRQPLRAHENIYVFSKKGAAYNRIDITGDFPGGRKGGRTTSSVYGTNAMPNTSVTVEGKRCPTSVIRIPNPKKKGGHPTAKPVDLYSFLIERYSPPKGLVLDPTFGSGNSGVACNALGRRWIGIEKDRTFFDKFVAYLFKLKKIDMPEKK
jgi:site-specific DNA-methyltransferase (adenine-specific)